RVELLSRRGSPKRYLRAEPVRIGMCIRSSSPAAKERQMKSLIKASGLALVGLALGCAASPEPQRMQPASATLPNTEPQVNMTVTHGDQVTAIDDALIVRDAQGRSFLMLFDGDVSCEHTLVA